jgi:flavin reductase (DIM6/NTAB) family NADH-FMN oxidoreductase RutF/rubredoxin
MNKSAFYKLSYGVYAVTTLQDGKPVGCIANSAMQITSKPATVAISINKDNFTHDCIQRCGQFALSVLSEQTDAAVIGTFGFQSSRNTNKFEAIPYRLQSDLPVLETACAWFTAQVTQQIDAGSHTIFLGTVTDCEVQTEETPMTYAYYHAVLKGKSPKAAPTYVEETPAETKPTEKKKYVCSVCGYVYEGDELPEDFVCPICKQPASAFREES